MARDERVTPYRKCYKEFMREMYEICKEDEVEDGNSVALPSNNND